MRINCLDNLCLKFGKGCARPLTSRQYDEAKIYHDGKWVMFEPTDIAEFDDYMKLLAIKRKLNRK